MKKLITKRVIISSLLLCSAIISGVLFFDELSGLEKAIKPELYGEYEEEDHPEGKNRRWTAKESKEYHKEFSKVQKSLAIIKRNKSRKTSGSGYADGSLNGFWQNRGPFNMPGAFQFCEMDEGTDTVYAVTCGHYGGIQFIWKGTLDGFDWEIINPKHPSRFEDLIVIPNSGGRRVLAGRVEDRVMYSDDSGESWNYSAGLSGDVKSTIVNRQDGNILYSTDGRRVYTSVDNGTSFQLLVDFGSSVTNTRLYSPRWASQPGASSVYLAREGSFYKLNAGKTSFDLIGTIPGSGVVKIGGDDRKLWATREYEWHYSTDGGATFTHIPITGYYYKNPGGTMDPGQKIGVNPENPDILIGGYTVPVITKDGGVTSNGDAGEYWGWYQNAVGDDPKVRDNYHPDFQSSQFFYNKDGQLMSLRSSDGGVFRSYSEWIPDGFPTYEDIKGVYYNISIFNQPTQETYRGGFIYGYMSPDHMSTGTQDQGAQDVRASTYGNVNLSWDQVRGGDGPCCITGDGKIGWSYNYLANSFARVELYSGTTYRGLSGITTPGQDFGFTGGWYFTPGVGDWEDGNRMWALSQTLRKVEYNTATTWITGVEHDLGGGSSYVQGVAQSQVNPDIVYAMKNGVVFKSTDRGNNYSQIATSPTTGIYGFSENRGMGWSSPLDENIVLFATQSFTDVVSIFSTDGGITWEDVTGTGANVIPNTQINGMAGTKNGKYVFASTAMGPYVFVVDEKKWYPLATDDDVPLFWGQIVYCVDYGDKEVVSFSTWGQGIWSFTIEEEVYGNDVAVQKVEVGNVDGCDPGDVTPQVTIQSNGTNTLNKVTIKVYANDELKQTLVHNTSLEKLETETIALNSITISEQTEIKVVVESPNDLSDELNTNNEGLATASVNGSVPQGDINILSYTTEETSGEGADNGRVIHMLDGDNNTFWHSEWTVGGATMPYEFVLDLGEEYNVTGVTWLSRQNNNNGHIATANIYVSNDESSFSDATLISVGNTNDLQTITFDEKVGRYLKLEVLSNHPGNINASLAEFNVLGCPPLVTRNENNISLNEIVVYPSPTNGVVKIEGRSIDQIEILDISGRLILSQKEGVQNGYTFDISNQEPGIYFVNISSGGEKVSKKIVKK